MSNMFLDTIKGISCSRPPVWFMRQAGRILPSYRKLKENHHFYDMMKDPELASEVTLLPINDLGVDSAILFSDILVIPDALGLELIFTKNGQHTKYNGEREPSAYAQFVQQNCN